MWVPTADLPKSAGQPFYERLNRVLDDAGFDAFVEAQCASFYADGVGRPSLAPGRYFRLLLLGYFEGLDSERAIAWRAADSLSIRAFLEYAVHEAPPDRPTLSRTRRLIDVETHQAVFTWVLQRLADATLVVGRTVGIDATTLEANAAMRSIVRRDTSESYDAFLTRLGVDTVEQETDQIQLVEGRCLPRGQLRGGLGDKPAADGALTHAAAGDVGRERLQTPGIASGAHADQQLLDGAPPQWIGLGHRLEGRERHLLAPRADPGAADRYLPPPEDDGTRHRPSPRRRAVGSVRVARPADRRPILLEHGVQDLQSRLHRKVEPLRFGVNYQLDERQPTRARRFKTGGRTDCARLLHGGSFAVRRVASGCPPLVYHEQ